MRSPAAAVCNKYNVYIYILLTYIIHCDFIGIRLCTANVSRNINIYSIYGITWS